ncbi:AMP-binding protein [Streptomyces catenulae]|uniref:AMP-binding protein n=1 Tax=Streptomyces catenulae TaxID=66875 RepID=A0ABV2Z542_9ACTN|nr:AMP-binding protein [Streptomyces catenulae]
MTSEHADGPSEPRASRRPGGSRPALTWSGEPGRLEELTHGMLLDRAERAATVLSRLGVGAGDRVAVHLPLVPESVIVTLACGQLDAIRTTLPVQLTAPQLAERIQDSDARVLVTADAAFWEGSVRPVKPVLDRALHHATCREVTAPVLVVSRCARPVGWKPGRDHWWHDELEQV